MFDPMQSMNAFAAGAQMGSGIRNRETQNAFSKKIGAGDLQGARQYAYDRGAMDLGQSADAMIAQMGAQERAQAAQRAETLARSAMTLKGIADPTQRTQAYMQMMPQLEGAGLSAQELQKFNPTDDNALQAIINQVTPLAELLKAQAPQKMMNVAPGNTVFNPNTGQPVFTAEKPAQEITPYQQAQLELQRDRLDWDKTKPRAPLVQVNTGDEGPPLPTRANLTPLQLKMDERYAEQLVNWNIGGSGDTAKQLSQLSEVASRLESGDNLTGWIIGNMPDWMLSGLNPRAMDTRELVQEVVQRSLRETLGPQFTENEGKLLMARAYNPSLDEKTNAQRLKRLIASIEARAQQLNSLNEYMTRYGTSQGWTGNIASAQEILSDMDAASGGANTPAAGQKRLVFNPATGEFE